MDKKVELTFNELSVLNAFGKTPEASIPKLAVEARLTPTEMKLAVSSLAKRSLIATSKDGNFARLTYYGKSARSNFSISDDRSPFNNFFQAPPTNDSPDTETEMERGK